MDNNEKHTKRKKTVNADMIADSMRAEAKIRRRENTRKTTRLWLWFGILVLIAILLYWLFSIGLMEKMAGVF